jgi:hypothetical protein
MTSQPETTPQARYIAERWPSHFGTWCVTDTATATILIYVADETVAHIVADSLNQMTKAACVDGTEDNLETERCDPDDTYLCCPQCGNTDFIEVPRHTDQGLRYFLQCDNDDCAVVIIQ